MPAGRGCYMYHLILTRKSRLYDLSLYAADAGMVGRAWLLPAARHDGVLHALHGLALTLTGRQDAAAISGLAFGFNPFRIAHVEHLELLLAFGMPLALLALHRYIERRQWRWVVLFGTALIVQALSSSYYALFFTVFFALWVAWFARSLDWRALAAIGVCRHAAPAGLGDVLLLHPLDPAAAFFRRGAASWLWPYGR